MKVNSFKALKFFGAILVLFFSLSVLPVFAEDNVISSIVISKAKGKLNTYDVNIDSTKKVAYRTKITQDGEIYFDLKNSILSDESGTYYDDATDIDNVVVKQIEKNKVRIYLKGKNVQNSNLVFINSMFETKQTPQQVTINRPMSDYQPVNYDSDLDSQEDIQDWDDNSFNAAHLMVVVLNSLKNSPFGIILAALLLLVILVTVIKSLAYKLSQEAEPVIGLNGAETQSFDIGTIPIHQVIPNSKMYSDKRETSPALKNAQMELSKAQQKYQDYLQNKYKKPAVSPRNLNISNATRSIALNQYQKNDKNPYMGQEVLKMDNVLNQAHNVSENFKIPPRPKMQTEQHLQTSYIQKPLKNKYTTPTPKASNNMKFLESVSQIYEQSGRSDLAKELKHSISKAKTSM